MTRKILLACLAAAVLCVLPAAAQTYSCSPAAAVPDNGYDGTLGSMSCCTITVPSEPGGNILDDVDVQMGINATWVGDLTIKVVNPGGGTVVTVLNRPGSSAPDDGTDSPFGDSSNWAGDVITFDDESAGPSAEDLGTNLGSTDDVVCADDGICSFVPAADTASAGDLSSFDGPDPTGDWMVCVGDSAAGDATTFDSAALVMTRSPVELQSFTIE